MLIGNRVKRAEYFALLSAVGGLIFTYDDDASYDEEQKEGKMPALVHCNSYWCVFKKFVILSKEMILARCEILSSVQNDNSRFL